MKFPLVSIIITTKNEEAVIEKLLKSLQRQTYKNIEIIVVDNNSSDKTKQLAKKYTPHVFDKGPERSAQRNFGAAKAKGVYLMFLDADMVLMPSVVRECVALMLKRNVAGIIIPEKSIGEGKWAKVKAFERSFYIGDDNIEAARFYDKDVFEKTGGFDEEITGPEDWELSERMKKAYGLGRIDVYILHNEGNLSLQTLMRKKYYYGKKAAVYLKKARHSTISPQTVFFLRSCFYRHWQKLFAHPLLTIGMIWMLSCETLAGVCGVLYGKFIHGI